MKRNEIKVGKYYTNERGRFRKVTAEGGEFVLYPGQEERDCLEFEAWVAVTKRGKVVGYRKDVSTRPSGRYHSTRASFASWAVREMTEAEQVEVFGRVQ